MVIDMNEKKLTTLEQLRQFLVGTDGVDFQPGQDDTRYAHIADVLRRFQYHRLKRPDKGVVLRYLMRTTGYSRQQLTRLVAQFLAQRQLKKHYRPPKAGFATIYTAEDVALLAETDALHNTLSGPATCALLQRAVVVHGDARYERLAQLSVGHLYNLRKRAGYVTRRQHWTKTKGTTVAIGERRAPSPDGRPGFIRIDSVHQGDQDGVKGVYHINAVDCETQWELVATCEKISESFLLPVIQELLAGFPFRILGFHADNGSEYINHKVARLLDKLQAEFTKSRPRHSNDNGLAETKNGAIVRKQLGYAHIPQHFATEVNAFCRDYLNPYINFHRPCLFPETVTDAKGKTRKIYPRHLIKTPFEKLKSIPNAASFLKPSMTIEQLEKKAKKRSDNEAAEQLNQARKSLFLSIQRRSKVAA
jgi:transposase InsO family protein